MISVFKPSIKRKDMDRVLTCLISDFIGFGERAREFIHLISQYLEAEAGVGFRDYSVAFGSALDLLELEPGSSVIISPLSPAFYYYEIKRRGFDVVYADVNPVNGCMDLSAIAELQKNTPAALFLHFPLGFIPDLALLENITIPVVMDISSAFSGTYKGQSFCQLADILIVSLEEEGIITAGGGTLVVSGKSRYVSKIQKFRKIVPVTSLLTDINASLGTVQFHQMDSFLEKRKAIDEIFRVSLMRGRHTRLLQEDDSNNVPFSFPVLLEGNIQDVRQYARKKNIRTKIAFEDAVFLQHQIERYSCPNALSIVKRSILFPLYPSLSKRNIEIISKVLTTLP